LVELAFEKRELETRVADLEATVQAKDTIIREYLRRVALLEFAIRRGDSASVRAHPVPKEALHTLVLADTETPPMSGRELVKAYLDELGGLSMPEIAETDLESFGAELDNMADLKGGHVPEEEPIGEWEGVSTISASLGPCRALALNELRGVPCLLVGTEEGHIRIWTEYPQKLSEGEIDVRNVCLNQNIVNPHIVLRHHSSPVTALGVSGDRIVSGDSSGHIAVCNVKNIAQLELFPSCSDLVAACSLDSLTGAVHADRVNAFHLNTSYIASVANDNRIVVSSFSGARNSFDMPSTVSSINEISDKDSLILGFSDGSLRSIYPETGACSIECEFGNSVTALDIMDTVIAFTQMNGVLSLFDYRCRSLVQTTMESLPTCISVSAPRLVIGGTDGSVRMYDVRNLNGVVKLWSDSHVPHSGEGVLDVGFSSAGTFFISSGSDGKIKFYTKL
jgi:WD40 repeat protein